MRHLFVIFALILVLSSCQKQAQSNSDSKQTKPDSAEIAGVIHGFYQWYGTYAENPNQAVDFTKVVNNHLTLDMPMLEKYLAQIKSSGFVSDEFLNSDRAFYQKCEKFWAKESSEEVPTGMDADKYFCAQDWDINYWTKSPVRIKPINADKVAATLYGIQAEASFEQNFELKKENGKWLISKIECDMGLDSLPSK
ncbi:MAG: YbjP/YqhG family protein [Bacteroidia bacterium]|nr:YbjP/YqhG family protein [Bacteroidia bacterium]